MADEVASLVVRLAMSDTSFQQGIQNLNREMKLIDSEFKKTISSSANFGDSVDGLKAKSEYLSQTISSQNKIIQKHSEALTTNQENLKRIANEQTQLKTKVDSAKEAWQKSTTELGKNAEETIKLKEEYDKLSAQYDKNDNRIRTQVKSIDNHNIAMNKAQAEINKMTEELKQNEIAIQKSQSGFEKFTQSCSAIGPKLESIGKSMQKLGATMSVAITTPLTLMGKKVVQTGADFEQGMAKVSAVSGSTGDELLVLEQKARDMGSTTIFSATQAAEAMLYMSMAGWKSGDMLQGLDGVMTLAAASGESLATVSDIVTDAMTAFGLQASESGRFADVLAKASSESNTNVAMMGETFKYVAPIAGALGFSIEDTSLAIGLMANSGIKASQAGTSLRQIIMGLQGDAEVTSDSFGKLNISTTTTDGAMRSFEDIILQLRDAFAQMTQEEKAMNAESIAGKVGMSGLLAIVNAGEKDFNKLSTAINDSTGAASGMSEVMQDTVQGSFKILQSAIQEAMISLYQRFEPAIRSVIDTMTEWVQKFMELPEWVQTLIINITLIVAALGPLLVIGGLLVSGIGSLITGLGSLSILLTPIGAIIATVVVAIGGLIGVIAKHSIEQKQLNDEIQKTIDLQTKGIESNEQSISSAKSEMDVLNKKISSYEEMQSQHQRNVLQMEKLRVAMEEALRDKDYEKVEKLNDAYSNLEDETMKLNVTSMEMADTITDQYGTMQNAQERLEAYKDAITNAEFESTLLNGSFEDTNKAIKEQIIQVSKAEVEVKSLAQEFNALSNQENLNASQTKRLEVVKSQLIDMFGKTVIGLDSETGRMQVNMQMIEMEIGVTGDLATAKIRAVNAMNEGGIARVNAQRVETEAVILLLKQQIKACQTIAKAMDMESQIRDAEAYISELDNLAAKVSTVSASSANAAVAADEKKQASSDKTSKKKKENEKSALDLAIESHQKKVELGQISLDSELSTLEQIKQSHAKNNDDIIQINDFAQRQMLDNIKTRVEQESLTSQEQIVLYEQVKDSFCLNEQDKQTFNKMINDTILDQVKEMSTGIKDLNRDELLVMKDSLESKKVIYKDNKDIVQEIDKQILETKKEIYKDEVDELKETVDLLIAERKRQYDEEKMLLDDELQGLLSAEQGKLDELDKIEKQERDREREGRFQTDIEKLEQKLRETEDAKEQANIRQDIREKELEREKYHLEQKRNAERDNIKQTMEEIKKTSKQKQEQIKLDYEKDVEVIKEHQKFQQEVLNQKLKATTETEQEITKKTTEELQNREQSLIKNMESQLQIYRNQIPNIQNVGTAYGNKLYEGIKSTEQMIDSYIQRKLLDMKNSINSVQFSRQGYGSVGASPIPMSGSKSLIEPQQNMLSVEGFSRRVQTSMNNMLQIGRNGQNSINQMNNIKSDKYNDFINAQQNGTIDKVDMSKTEKLLEELNNKLDRLPKVFRQDSRMGLTKG